MNKIKKFKQMNESKSYADTITLWPEELEVFSREETHPDYPGLTFESDTDEGDFDSEKGAMYDYPVYLTNDDTGETWKGYGGYYTGPTGEVFNYEITFTKSKKEDKNIRTVEVLEVWYSIQSKDGSSYTKWFLTEDDAKNDPNGKGTGSVETFVGSDIYDEAVSNSK